ncbi:MAG: Gfo/Idh/MocA family oxidoreductase [Thermoproteota archaeon]
MAQERKPAVNLAIAGCGGIAREHLKAYARINEKEPEKFRLVALNDVSKEAVESFADEAEKLLGYRPSTFLDTREMLNTAKPKAVDICTPHSEHHRVAIECIKSGADVMVEKPLGVTLRASKAIIAAGRKHGRIVATAENIRRGINQRTMHWILNEAKLIGKPRMFYAIHASWADPLKPRRWHWRIERNLSGGGLVMDSGAHFCDSIRYFFGEVERVYAFVGQLEKWPHDKQGETVYSEVEDSWVALISFENGLVGTWGWTMAAPGHSFTKVVYYGSEGCLLDSGDVFHGPFDGAVLVLKDGTQRTMPELREEFLKSIGEEGRNRLFPHGFTDGMTLECYDFLEAVKKRRRPEVDGEDGMRAKAIAEAIYESAKLRASVRYMDVLRGRVSAYQNPIDKANGLLRKKR